MTHSSSDLSPDLLKTVQGFIAMVNNPGNIGAVFDVADGLRHTDLYHHFLEYAHTQPTVQQLLEERYLAPAPDLDQLLSYPPQSLGYHYASTLKAAGLVPDFYRVLTVEDDYSYIALRMRQTHDIWHLITGFGTDLAGELGLQAFTLAQTHSPLAVAILSAAVMHILKVSGPLHLVVDSMQKGWQLGEQTKPFLGQKWEEHWEWSVAEWQAIVAVYGCNTAPGA